MIRPGNIPKSILYSVACLFAAATVLYTFVWMYYTNWQPAVAPIGLQFAEPVTAGALEVVSVVEAGPAATAGFHPGDRITAINHKPVASAHDFYDAVTRGQPGDEAHFEVRRPANPGALTLSITFAPAAVVENADTLGATLARELAHFYPLLFLFMGLYVLFARIEDSSAWLLALLFASFIAGPGYDRIRAALHPDLRPFILSYGTTFAYLGPAFFYGFFATFPDSSPIEKRAPWLKWMVLALCAMVALPTAAALLFSGLWYPFYVQTGWATPEQYNAFSQFVLLGFVLLGFVALITNAFEEKERIARRKYRVMLWGTIVGFGPEMLRMAASVAGVEGARGRTVQLVCLALLTLVPLSLAHAVVKHRVMELPVLLKRTSRYVLVRGAYSVAMLGLSALLPWLLARAAVVIAGAERPVTLPLAMLVGVAFGMIWAASAARVERLVKPKIDRAFFRSVYNTQQILEDLTENLPTAASRPELASMLERQMVEALHPESIAIYLSADDGTLRLESFSPGPVPASMEFLNGDAPLLQELAQRGRPWEVPPADVPVPPNLPQLGMLRDHLAGHTAVRDRTDVLAQLVPLQPECLVPIVKRGQKLAGLMALGQRLSEEPYSDEDQKMLGAVAGQAGVALVNIHLAEQMAARLEAETRRANEMSIAREVQAKLFPQRMPPLATLEYAGSCDQARTIGGDYYDYLDLGKGRAGLVLADISGKGIFAALLMANLQANLRSQYAIALEGLGELMRSVNGLFFESVTPGLYATMFIADYADGGRRLRYVNCGHNPPLLVRATGACEKLGATATVLGLMEEWDCTVGEVTLAPGDLLVIYSDGVTEASSDEGEFFGDQRLEEAIRQNTHLCASELTKKIAATVRAFSGKEQEDDLTLLVARAR